MKRRTFITTSLLAAAGLSFAYYFKIRSKSKNTLTRPYLLSLICNQPALLEIGKSYRKLVPGESQLKILSDLILTNRKGQKLNSAESLSIDHWINNKIEEDFLNSQTLIINGWVISQTEARQCAFLSLTT
jgi:hypothetical protein